LGYSLRKLPIIDDTALYKSLYANESLDNKCFYNIGAGNFEHPYWTNVDYDNEWYKDNRDKTLKGIQYDLFSLQPIPVKSNTAEIVYTSHTIEHITNAAAQNMFNEAYRILKPGGYFRLTTPDIDLAFNAYRKGDRTFFHWIDYYSKPYMIKEMKLAIPMEQASLDQIFLYYFASSVSTLHSHGSETRIQDSEIKKIFSEKPYEDALDYCISRCPIEIQKKFAGNHINWWNQKKVIRMLEKSGFTQIYRSGFGQSATPPLRNTNLFDNTHPELSLFVEAIK
jgi:predicted SAM-dependent methyltransferase